MAASELDIVVLRQGLHGIPITEYVEALRERLPDHNIEHARTPAAERKYLKEANIATGYSPPDDVLGEATELALFAGSSAGVGHLPLDTFEEYGITVTNASGVHASTASEHVIGNILVSTRRFQESWRRERDNEWRHHQTDDLEGSTVTVVGQGAIGTAVVDRLDGFNVKTIGVRHSPEKGGPADEVIGYDEDEFHEALAGTDFLVLACPLTDLTDGLVSKEELVTLPPNAVIVNVARGPVVDTDDLVHAIQENWIHGAALGVTDPEPLPNDHPLWDFGNVQITPHNAGHTPRYYELLADILAENVSRIEETGEYVGLRNQVSP